MFFRRVVRSLMKPGRGEWGAGGRMAPHRTGRLAWFALIVPTARLAQLPPVDLTLPAAVYAGASASPPLASSPPSGILPATPWRPGPPSRPSRSSDRAGTSLLAFQSPSPVVVSSNDLAGPEGDVSLHPASFPQRLKLRVLGISVSRAEGRTGGGKRAPGRATPHGDRGEVLPIRRAWGATPRRSRAVVFSRRPDRRAPAKWHGLCIVSAHSAQQPSAVLDSLDHEPPARPAPCRVTTTSSGNAAPARTRGA